MSFLEVVLSRFGPLLTYADLAKLFGHQGPNSGAAIRQRLRRDKILGERIMCARVCLGRRVHFRADLVAEALERSMGAGSEATEVMK